MLTYLRANVYAAAAAAADHAPCAGMGLRARGASRALLVSLRADVCRSVGHTFRGPCHRVARQCPRSLSRLVRRAGAVRRLETGRAADARLTVYAILPAAAAVAAIKASQLLWAPAAGLTFRLVRVLLHPLLPELQSDPTTLVPRYRAIRRPSLGNMLGPRRYRTSPGILWRAGFGSFARDYYFPRALLIVPFGVLVMFLLNAVRIAAIVLIGNAGYDRVAILGFHSQAGWIAFNLTAFGIAVLAHRTPWLSRVAHRARTAAPDAPDARTPRRRSRRQRQIRPRPT